MTSSRPSSPVLDPDTSGGGAKLQRSLGLFSGVAIILGTIIGSGIFLSPAGVLVQTGSPGLALLVWALTGVACLFGALTFAELGTLIQRSGAMYAYIGEAFGGFAAFVHLWGLLLLLLPAGNAAIAITAAYYMVQPFFPGGCDLPDPAVRLFAALAICLLTFINCASVRLSAAVQNVFFVTKVLALVMIILTGIIVLSMGKYENFLNAFDGSTTNLGRISLAVYSGLYSYSGWNSLNFLTEELKDPYKNLPRAIWISMPLVTAIYVLANVAYIAVLTPAEIIASDAVAVSFAMRMYGVMAWIVPVFVAMSTFGSLNGCMLSMSRTFFVGARYGHMPDCVALIQLQKVTPVTAVLFQGVCSLLLLFVPDVYTLVNYHSLIEAASFLACALALLYLRWKRPDAPRPIKVNLIIPIVFIIICVFLLVFPLFHNPMEIGVGFIALLTGVPVYMICVAWTNKPRIYTRYMASFTKLVQKLFIGVKEDYSE